MSSISVVAHSVMLVDDLMARTHYEDAEDGRQMFVRLRDDLEVASETVDGQRLMHKFDVLCRAVSTPGTFGDMVKIIWRMVKAMRGGPVRRLSFLLLGIASIHEGLVSRGVSDGDVSAWAAETRQWLALQLVSGGRGVEEVPEGKEAATPPPNAQQRLARFFATPYLHDYD